MLLLVDINLRVEIRNALFVKFNLNTYLFTVIFILGIIFSVYHVFIYRLKTEWEKIPMLVFAVYVNLFSGIAGGLHALKTSEGLLAIFPIWNIINGVLLYLMYRLDIVDTINIVDDDVSSFQIILGTTVVLIALALCHFVFNLYWAVTFSVCVSYATNINWIIQRYFFPTNEK
jgi:hypothetical protein